jgi:hypothetical protein
MEDEKFGQILIREHLGEAFKVFGIEGTEQVILNNFKEMPEMQAKLLEEYNKIIVEYARK